MEQFMTNLYIGWELIDRYWILLLLICGMALFLICSAIIISHAYMEENEHSIKIQDKLRYISWVIIVALLSIFIAGVLIHVGCKLYFLINF